MKPFSLSRKASAERFQRAFQRRVPSFFGELDYGEVYGTAKNNGYSFYVKVKPKSFLSCW